MVRLAILSALLILAGCAREPVPTTARPPAGRPPAGATVEPAGFTNRVWQVRDSPTVEAGSIYVFLSDSTLVLTAPHSVPTFGAWRRDGDGLVLVEEGIAYPATIVTLTADRFDLRVHGPGDPVDLALVPAPSSR